MSVQLTITKKLFDETIKALDHQYAHDQRCSDAFKIILPDAFPSLYDNYTLSGQLIHLLKLAFQDEEDSWIEYFIYELEFGRNYTDGCAKMADGSHIKLYNASDLYDFLLTNYTDKQK